MKKNITEKLRSLSFKKIKLMDNFVRTKLILNIVYNQNLLEVLDSKKAMSNFHYLLTQAERDFALNIAVDLSEDIDFVELKYSKIITESKYLVSELNTIQIRNKYKLRNKLDWIDE